MKDQLKFATAMAEINRLEAKANDAKRKEKDSVHNEHAPAAAKKLEHNGRNFETRAVTVADIQAILFKVYNISMSGSKLRQADFVRALHALHRDSGQYEEYILSLDLRSNNDNANENVEPTVEDQIAEVII